MTAPHPPYFFFPRRARDRTQRKRQDPGEGDPGLQGSKRSIWLLQGVTRFPQERTDQSDELCSLVAGECVAASIVPCGWSEGLTSIADFVDFVPFQCCSPRSLCHIHLARSLAAAGVSPFAHLPSAAVVSLFQLNPVVNIPLQAAGA